METFKPSGIVLAFTLLIWKVLCNPLSSDQNATVTYAELEALGGNCYPLNTCERSKRDYTMNPYSCDCDKSCTLYNTCCVDSEFRIHKESHEQKSNLRCLNVYNSGFELFMVDRCKSDETFDDLCSSNPEENNDPFLIVPVTSNVTGITYKNYFCAVCNEEVDSTHLEVWDLEIRGIGTMIKNLSDPQFTFDKINGVWKILDGNSDETPVAVPVTLSVQSNHKTAVKYCISDTIGNCSNNWTNNAVQKKCRDYMAIVTTVSQNVKYKNPHCALCNFKNLSDLQCVKFGLLDVPIISLSPSIGFAPARRPSVGTDNPLISLFVLEDKKTRCGKNMVYDKFADKCRCNSRIYIKESRNCVHKI